MKVLLGPVGELREVPCLPVVSVDTERRQSEMTLLDGSRYVQVARRRHRTWSWDVQLSTSADLAWLAELASGGVVGPYYLYTSKAARENLAPPQLQSGGSGVVAGRRVLAAGDPEVGTSREIPVLPNRVYCLSALGDGVGSVTVTADDPHAITNLATNPSFETPGATVEVRRNYHVNPGAVSLNGFSFWNGGTGNVASRTVVDALWGISGKAAQSEWTESVSDEGDIGPLITYATAGETWTVAFDVAVGRDGTVLGGVAFGGTTSGSTLSARSHTDPEPLAAGQVQRRWMTFVKSETAGTNLRSSVSIIGRQVGDEILISNVDLYPGTYDPTRGAFSGSYSPDPDLTPEWTGTVNESASILSAQRPAYVTFSTGRVAIQSGQWTISGSKSLRVVTDSNASGAVYTAGLVSGKTYTAVAWCYFSSLGATTDQNSRALWYLSASNQRAQAPAEPGVHLVRFTFTVDGAETTLRIGGQIGGSDVWWDDLTIVEGEHPDLMPFGQASSASAVLTPPTGGRASVTILSGDATHVTLTTTAGVGQLRLTEGPHEGFMPGDGVAPVMVQDPQETLQRVIDGDHRSDFGVTLKEIG